MSVFSSARRTTLSLSASIATLALMGFVQPAYAQAVTGAPVTDTTPATDAQSADAQITPAETAQETPAPGTEIVVTGSRIRRNNFDTPNQVNVITREDRVLAGSASTSDILQSSAVTSGTSQINGAFLGFVSEGGPAASTVGLRGLSSSRTLVLLNGRRLAPAGVGPQLVSADLNTLPTAMVQRIEVLREGASSVYGSDAIAGVVNVITDTKFKGLTLDAFTNQPVEHGGGGRTYRLSATAGTVWDTGHITVSAEYRELTGLRVGDRPEFSCPRDLFRDANGVEVGQHDPATGQLMCFPYTTGGGSGIASGYGIAQSFFAANRVTLNQDLSGFRVVNGLDRVGPSSTQLRDHLISPVRTYTGYANASQELGFLGDAEIYGEALFTRRESSQDSTYQFNYNSSDTRLSPRNQIYGGNYAGTPLSAYGYPVSPFFPNVLANAGYVIFTPFIVPDRTTTSRQRVDFLRVNGGVRGGIGIGDWRYDANFQYSRTDSRYSVEQIDVRKLNNALQVVQAPAGTPENLIVRSLPNTGAQVPGDTTFGPPGTAYTCASNVSGGAIVAGATCVPFNIYDPSIMLGGHIPANVFDYLFDDQVGTTKFLQQTISINLDGSLFNLPAGPVRASVGFEHRYDHIDDLPSEAAQTNNLYNYSSANRTVGSDLVDEVYGEINVPILKDKPFFHTLEVSGSARYTHYRSYGSDTTYHANGQWAPTSFLRFRGNYGTSFRAPNLYEQYVADQTGFYGAGVDPCANVANLPAGTVKTNCLAALTPILGAAGAANFIGTAGPKVTTRGGAGNLKAEHSTSYGFGGVLTLPKHLADLSLAVDYYHVQVTDEVSTLGNVILDRCYEATDFPNNQYCNLIAPRLPASSPQKGNLSSFLNPYLNVAQQVVEGVDFDLRYATEILGGKFVLQGNATRMLHQKFQTFAEDPLVDYNGTLGVQGFGAGPKWVGSAEVRYTLPSEPVTFRYGVQYVGPQDSGDGQAVAAPLVGNVFTDLRAEPYWEHGVSIQFRWEKVGQITFGVNNLFNALPPMISSYPTSGGQFTRVGNYFNSSNYDLLGRTAFLNVTRSF